MTQADDAFLQAILASPDDDAPRLAYADWLDEHGRPDRAAFIRVQCRLARLPGDAPTRPGLEAAERRLLAEHGREWAGPLAGVAESWEFRRGFVEAVTVPSNLLGQADALLRSFPIRHVKVLPRLTGPADRTLDLEPLRYQSDPGAGNDDANWTAVRVRRKVSRVGWDGSDYDANWLVVRVTARDGETKWSAAAPALLTWELLDLADWFRHVADVPAGAEERWRGIEPDLLFRAKAGEVTAFLAAEFGPPQERGGVREAAIDFQPGAEVLRGFADGLSLVMRAFPVRVVASDGPASRHAIRRPP